MLEPAKLVGHLWSPKVLSPCNQAQVHQIARASLSYRDQ